MHLPVAVGCACGDRYIDHLPKLTDGVAVARENRVIGLTFA
jgi:hypothetical protein